MSINNKPDPMAEDSKTYYVSYTIDKLQLLIAPYDKPKYQDKFKQELEAYTTNKIIEARIETAINAMAIALYWLKEDGRPKHLVQDLWDTINAPEVLDHIDKKWFEEARGHFNDQLKALNHRKDKDD